MTSLRKRLERLPSAVEAANDGQAASTPDMDRFRADFKEVFGAFIRWGYHTKGDYDHAARAVRENAHDAEWMACASAHFAELVTRIRADIARSERIRAEIAAQEAG